MSHFDKQALEHLKKLCRIDCDEREEADILKSLNRILEYIGQLDEVQVDGLKPCNYVIEAMVKNSLRKDEVKNPMPRDRFLANAPDQIAGMIRVPPVMKAP